MGYLMLKESEKVGTTQAGKYKHPTYPDCLNWVAKSWKDLNTAGVLKKAKDLGMTAEPGPEIEGYEDENFSDQQPVGPEVEVRRSSIQSRYPDG